MRKRKERRYRVRKNGKGGKRKKGEEKRRKIVCE